MVRILVLATWHIRSQNSSLRLLLLAICLAHEPREREKQGCSSRSSREKPQAYEKNRRLENALRKGIVAMVCQILAPLRQGAVRYSQFTGDLGLRLPAGFDKAHRFDLEFLGVRFLLFLHGTCSPLWRSLFRVSSLHKGGP
jgi:hypothetical protein